MHDAMARRVARYYCHNDSRVMTRGPPPVLDDRANGPPSAGRERHHRKSLFLCFFSFLFFLHSFTVYPKAPLLIYKREALEPF
jgi:hypothetical protein